MNKISKKTSSNISMASLESKEYGLSLTSLRKKFFWALSWNIGEALVYQTIFIIHQSLLFYYVPKATYGAASALLGFSFAGIIIMTGALDTTLMSWITEFTQDKISYRHCIRKYLVPQVLLYLATPLLIKILSEIIRMAVSPTTLAGNSTLTLFIDHWILIGLFIAVEGLRKLLRHLAQLMFMNKQIALLELLHLIVYCVIVWTLYFINQSIKLTHLITPFIVVSSVLSIVLVKILYDAYQQLPDIASSPLPVPTSKNIYTTRTLLCINQIIRTLFSSNIFIPIASALLGFTQTGYLAYINYVLYTITFCMYKICIPAAAALFGHITHLAPKLQQRAFSTAFIPALWTIAVITTLLGALIFYGYWSLLFPFKTLICLLILGFSHIIETLYTLYEKFFIIRKQLTLLTISNISHLILGYSLLLGSFSIFYTLSICSIVRILTVGVLSYVLLKQSKTT